MLSSFFFCLTLNSFIYSLYFPRVFYIQNKSLGIWIESSCTQNESPDIQIESFCIQNESSDIQIESSCIQNESLGI